MGAAMQLYAGFALLVIVILLIIAVIALFVFLQRVARRLLGRATGRDDLSPHSPSQRRSPPSGH
jgi:preprotein translocase subunit SecY